MCCDRAGHQHCTLLKTKHAAAHVRNAISWVLRAVGLVVGVVTRFRYVVFRRVLASGRFDYCAYPSLQAIYQPWASAQRQRFRVSTQGASLILTELLAYSQHS